MEEDYKKIYEDLNVKSLIMGSFQDLQDSRTCLVTNIDEQRGIQKKSDQLL